MKFGGIKNWRHFQYFKMATVTLTLIHAEKDILIEVNVSAADAERASTGKHHFLRQSS